MTSIGGSLTGPIVAGVSLLVATIAIVLHFMPDVILYLLLAWAVLSIPIGIAVGHCALGRDEAAAAAAAADSDETNRAPKR